MLLQICGLQKLGDIYSCDRVGPPTGQKPPEFIMFQDFISKLCTKTSHNDSKTVKELKVNSRLNVT